MPYLNPAAGRAREAAQAAPVALLGDSVDLSEVARKVNEVVAKLVAAGVLAPPLQAQAGSRPDAKKRQPLNKSRRPPNKTSSQARPRRGQGQD